MRYNPQKALLAAALGLLMSGAAQADVLMKWERIPLQIPLKTGQERVVFVDKNVRVGFPPALNGKLRVQSTGGAVYLRADGDFPQTRLQLQDVQSGEVILLDVTASAKGPADSAEPVKLVYSGDVTTLSGSADTTALATDGSSPAGDASSGSGKATTSTATPKKPRYAAPLPMVLTRYAAQSLYGPLRTVEAVPGIHPLNPHLPAHLTTLYPSEPLDITPLAGWGVGPRSVVALRVRNTAGNKIVLDPRVLQGLFVSATFQHRWLGAAGTPEDTTTLYLVTAGRPEQALVAEPVIAVSNVSKGKGRQP